MSRAGRKRKIGPRQPDGRLAPKKLLTARTNAAASNLLDHLLFRGAITRDQHWAGTRYASITGAYRAVIGTPRGLAGSGRGSSCAIDEPDPQNPCASDPPNCECVRRRRRYDAAHAAVFAAGQRAAKVVARVAVFGEAFVDQDGVYLERGLDALRAHFELTESS